MRPIDVQALIWAVIFAGLLIFVFLLVMPIVVIWSLNKLFRLDIGFSFETWMAVVILLVVLKCLLGVRVVHKTVNAIERRWNDE